MKHGWFKFGSTGGSLFLQVPQLGWFLCSWTVLFERFQQTVSSSLFSWYTGSLWSFVEGLSSREFPEFRKWMHLSHDLQEVYSTSIPVDFVSRVSSWAHPTPTIYWTSSPSSPPSPYRLSWHILTILTILTISTILTFPHHPHHPDRPASFWEWSHLMFIPPAACMIRKFAFFHLEDFSRTLGYVGWLSGDTVLFSFMGLHHCRVSASGFP